MENNMDNQDMCINYRKLIIEMAENIHDQRMLESIYSFIMGILSVKEKQEAD